jgi:hypothetical protein
MTMLIALRKATELPESVIRTGHAWLAGCGRAGWYPVK